MSVTVIAYQLVQVIRTHLRAAGRRDGWAALRRILEGQRRVTATFLRCDDGRTLHVRKARHDPKHPKQPSTMPWASITHREGPERPSSEPAQNAPM